MADENPTSLSPSSPQSPSVPLDQSLVRAFGALEVVLTDLTTSSQNNSAAVQKLVPQVLALIMMVKEDRKIDAKHRETTLNILSKLTDSVDHLAQQEGVAVHVAAEARDALNAARAEIGQGLAAVKEAAKEISGEHASYDPDGAPKLLQIIILHLTNFGWKNKAKLIGWITAAGGVLGYAAHKIAPFWKEIVEAFK